MDKDNDAISRQAVMDAMYDLCGEESLKDNPWRDNPHIDSITDAIEHLPSVTPKQTDALDKIRAEIKEQYGGCGLINDGLDMALSIIDKYMAESSLAESTSEIPNKWIPVSERLPEDGTWNLFTDGKKISVERYKSDALDHFYPNGRWFSLEEAVAWMPLPEPYKAESEDTDGK